MMIMILIMIMNIIYLFGEIQNLLTMRQMGRRPRRPRKCLPN